MMDMYPVYIRVNDIVLYTVCFVLIFGGLLLIFRSIDRMKMVKSPVAAIIFIVLAVLLIALMGFIVVTTAMRPSHNGHHYFSLFSEPEYYWEQVDKEFTNTDGPRIVQEK